MRKKAAIFLLLLILLCIPTAAHSGGTDENGGHIDHSTGEYHYHHGYPAHQHDGGVCPYNFADKSGSTSGSSEKSGGSATVSLPSEREGPRFGDALIALLVTAPVALFTFLPLSFDVAKGSIARASVFSVLTALLAIGVFYLPQGYEIAEYPAFCIIVSLLAALVISAFCFDEAQPTNKEKTKSTKKEMSKMRLSDGSYIDLMADDEYYASIDKTVENAYEESKKELAAVVIERDKFLIELENAAVGFANGSVSSESFISTQDELIHKIDEISEKVNIASEKCEFFRLYAELGKKYSPVQRMINSTARAMYERELAALRLAYQNHSIKTIASQSQGAHPSTATPKEREIQKIEKQIADMNAQREKLIKYRKNNIITEAEMRSTDEEIVKDIIEAEKQLEKLKGGSKYAL